MGGQVGIGSTGAQEALAADLVDFLDFGLLFLYRLESRLFLSFEHACARSLLNHRQGLEGLHIEHLGDAALQARGCWKRAVP